MRSESISLGEVTDLKKYIPFVSFWVLNSLLLYLAELIFPNYFVLGNFWLSGPLAMLWAGLWLTVIIWGAMSLPNRLNLKISEPLKMFAFYWLTNFVAIWVLARFAALSGFGIAAFYWAISLGLVANLAQWRLWKGLEKAKLAGKN